jgi:hypothetical protein
MPPLRSRRTNGILRRSRTADRPQTRASRYGGRVDTIRPNWHRRRSHRVRQSARRDRFRDDVGPDELTELADTPPATRETSPPRRSHDGRSRAWRHPLDTTDRESRFALASTSLLEQVAIPSNRLVVLGEELNRPLGPRWNPNSILAERIAISRYDFLGCPTAHIALAEQVSRLTHLRKRVVCRVVQPIDEPRHIRRHVPLHS